MAGINARLFSYIGGVKYMATTTNMGTNVEILNLTLSDSTDTQIVTISKTNNILIRNRGAGDIYYRSEENSVEYFTIPEGLSLTIELGARNSTAGWLRAANNGDIGEVISMFGSL